MSLLSLLLSWGEARAQTAPARPDTAAGPARGHTEVMPVFPGQNAGDSARTPSQRVMHFLNQDFRYPPKALRDGVAGRVFFSFTVTAQGRTADIKLVKGLREDVDAEVLRIAHRLDAVQWRPGLQDGRAVSVSFTVPITLSISTGGSGPARGPEADSLDLGPYQKMALPLASWSSDRRAIPAGKGLIYGSCLQRLGGSSSFGAAEYVRLVNLNTHKAVQLSVKPFMTSRRENAFCYALPAGRYALYFYAFPDPVWGPYRMHFENLRKPRATSAEPAGLAATRYQFVVEAGKVHYVGTWNLANENEPDFLDEKSILDARVSPGFRWLNLPGAQLAIPR